MSPDLVFSLLYLLLSFCVIYPPPEFVSAGFTVPLLFSKFLGSEEERFIQYHIRKSILYLIVYSFLPLGYILSLLVVGYVQEVSLLFLGDTLFWKIFATSSIVLPILAFYEISKWRENDYDKHPIAVNLSKFCNNDMPWKYVALSIDAEFRRIDKIIMETNSITKVIATENWIIKVTPLTILIAHQSDTALVVKEANSYQLSHISRNETQCLNIEISSSRRNVKPFFIRINTTDFKDLEDRIARSITILPNIKFHKSVLEKFVEVFKDTIRNNPSYVSNQDLDQCIGCLQARPNVKIQKLCEDSAGGNNCINCYCRPMWCVDCIAKWFASRQDKDQQNTWLSSKCTCPLCRATFCILDVSLLNNNTGE